VEWATDTSAAAIAARAAEQLSGATAEMVTQGNIEVSNQHPVAGCLLCLHKIGNATAA
jgi:hypothetical protein